MTGILSGSSIREGVIIVFNLVSCGVNLRGGDDGFLTVFAIGSCQTILAEPA